MCTGILPAHVCVSCLCRLPVEALYYLDLELQLVVSIMWVLGLKPRSLEEPPKLSTFEPSLQPCVFGFKNWALYIAIQ